MLSDQGKVGTHPLTPEDNTLVPTELRGNPREENREAAEEVYIADYVMHDFGFYAGEAAATGRYRTVESKRDRDASDTLWL